MRSRSRSLTTATWRILAGAGVIVSAIGPAVAHGGAPGGPQDPVVVPTWLVILAGGGVVGASFGFAPFVTDRSFIDAVHDAHYPLPVPDRFAASGRLLGIGGLVAVVAIAVLGPQATTNAATLLVWVGWWGGYVGTAYLVGDTWAAVNPFRTLAGAVPSVGRTYPSWLGSWPAVAGLLLLVPVEVLLPVASSPRALAAIIAAYAGSTAVGVAVFGADAWFDRGDPFALLFRYFGAIAPVQRTSDGWQIRVPGAALRDLRIRDRSEVGFVLAVVWITTFDGLVHTRGWNGLARSVLELGVPPGLIYLGSVVVGFLGIWGTYRIAVRGVRVLANTRLPRPTIERRFVVSLLPIGAGYHLAHSAGDVLARSPTMAATIADPLSPVSSPVLFALPAWFGSLQLVSVLAGHLLGIWSAHAIAYDLFPGRVQALRSQYALVGTLILFTAISVWLLTQPATTPAFFES